jgi:hypothetical protein
VSAMGIHGEAVDSRECRGRLSKGDFRGLAFLLVLGVTACSSGSAGSGGGSHAATTGVDSGEGSSTSGGSGGSTWSTSGSSGGSASSTSGSSGGSTSSDAATDSAASASSSSSGSSGSSGSPDGSTSSGGSVDASRVDGAGDASDFACNLVIGESPTGQWFDSGFLKAVDPSRWECIWIAHHYTNLWANPDDVGWTTPFDPYPPLAGPAHTCAQGAATPDRVIFVAAQWTETTAAEWEADLTAIVHNIENHYPTAKRVELMALTGGPSSAPCVFAGPGTNETVIPAVGYVAIDAMPAKFPGLVLALPHFDVPQCSDFVVDGGNTMPQYTTAGAIDVAAQLFGPYYAAHP